MSSVQRHTLVGSSSAAQGEPDWSQIGETLAMLALAIAQIDTSLHEGNQSVDQLTSSFTAMANNTQKILELSQNEKINSDIAPIAQEVNSEIQQAVIAFQFYDRLTQRLEHVGESLERMGHLMADAKERYQPDSWRSLQNHIKGNYTMEAERLMFEHIMAGNSVAEALEIYHHNFDKDGDETFGTDDEIELF
ncbi:hypothetical protein [Bacterioplanoides sp.]|uniref:hypothetical protein n=1 Tax=Bacterioplanoides sp. TaxID=2066072 RepID=UPI003B0067B2